MGLHALTGRPLPLITHRKRVLLDTRVPTARCGCRNVRPATSLIHPPAPVCRYCRSRDMGVRAVSGRATLAGFTVNHRFSLPGLPAPYVVAQVAIAEDPRVRLTTNIVDCDPDQLELGQQVEVVFEQVEDVWLPLFRPDRRRRARSPAGRRDRAGALRRIRPADADHGEIRGQGRAHRDRHVGDRAPADGAAAVADRATPARRRSPTPG